MSTTLYAVDGPKNVLRTNWAVDPHATSDFHWYLEASEALATLSFIDNAADVPSGATRGNFVRSTIDVVDNPGAFQGLSCRSLFDTGVQLDAATQYTVSLYARTSTLTPSAYTLYVDTFDANGPVDSFDGPATFTAADEWQRFTITFTTTGAADDLNVAIVETDPAGPQVGDTLDATMLLVEAGPTAGAYFDGDTPTHWPVTYAWTGTPDASPSLELEPDPAAGVTPDLVINYEHQVATGVTIFQPLAGGAPLIVRQLRDRFPSGTLELYCKLEETALELEALCNGARNVLLVSDDVPGAPYSFTPTGNVVVSWNTPYSSWKTAVPYARLT